VKSGVEATPGEISSGKSWPWTWITNTFPSRRPSVRASDGGTMEFLWNIHGSRPLLCGARCFRRSLLEYPPAPKYVRPTFRHIVSCLWVDRSLLSWREFIIGRRLTRPGSVILLDPPPLGVVSTLKSRLRLGEDTRSPLFLQSSPPRISRARDPPTGLRFHPMSEYHPEFWFRSEQCTSDIRHVI
jgi:hypothetical protein